jgi:hypothetical protein
MKTSRQYRWQQKKIAEGRCARCGAKRKHYTILCDSCQISNRVRYQQRVGTQPWHKGKRGRPPKIPQPIRGRARS